MSVGVIRGGERAARRRLERWLGDGPDAYVAQSDHLGAAATSRLSADLPFGCLSAREVIVRSRRSGDAQAFVRQLCWRDFFNQLLAANQGSARDDLRPRGDSWREDAEGLARSRAGRTGYPVVDAAMRQLHREGWMPGRARLIARSFLAKTLHVDCRLGERALRGLLVDGDLANNVGNWQSVAGTGAGRASEQGPEPAPPGQTPRPDGLYGRPYVPELAHLPSRFVHAPWRAPYPLRPRACPPPMIEAA